VTAKINVHFHIHAAYQRKNTVPNGIGIITSDGRVTQEVFLDLLQMVGSYLASPRPVCSPR
jgi:hypothetical protein